MAAVGRLAGLAATFAALICGCAVGQSKVTVMPGSGVTLVAGGGVWAPDGNSLARVDRRGIEVVTPGGKRTEFFPVRTPVRGLAWTGDGRSILFISKEPHQKPDRTERLGVATIGGDTRFSPLGTHVGSLSWSADGWPLAFATTYLYFKIVGGESRPPKTVPVGPVPALWTVDAFGQKPRRLLDLPGEERDPRISPDGRTVLFSLLDKRRRRRGTWVVGRNGHGLRRLTAALGYDATSWSPDGRTIAIEAAKRPDLRKRLYTVPAAGGPLRKLSPDEVTWAAPAWKPDGSAVAYGTYTGEIKLARADGSGTETLASLGDEEASSLSWSPDGTELAYTSTPIDTGD